MYTLFVLEDDFVQRYIIKHNLVKYPVFEQIYYYTNGAPLVDYLQANKTCADCMPDMMFVDLEMSGINGWNVLDELHALNQSLRKQITVYVISASIAIKDKLRALNYGFVKEFISKPVTKQQFNHISREAEKMLCDEAQLQ